MSRVLLVNKGKPECEMELFEKEDLVLDKRIAEFELASVKYSAVLSILMQRPEIQQLKKELHKAKTNLQQEVEAIMKRLELDSKQWKYNITTKQFEKQVVQ